MWMPVEDEDQMGRDFFGFLANLVKVFPSLKTRPLHITGESYSGTYIPYITKTYFGLEDPPVKLVKIAIGDGTLGSDWEFEVLPTLTVIETYPQLIGYDPDVYKYFREQSHLCGFDINLTYPQHGHFPTLNPQEPNFGDDAAKRASKKKSFNEAFKLDSHFTRNNLKVRSLEPGSERLAKRDQWKRDIIGRPNGTIDPYYGCDLYDEMIDYAVNFSLPWKGNDEENGFDVYQIPDALDPEAPMDASIFLNDNRTRAAIHAPTSKNWAQGINYPFNNSFRGDPSVEPMAFLTELATNASHRGVGNTTFGGIQGFTRKPSTPWYGDDGVFAGIVHQERNWTYILVKGAGHLVPQQQPERAFVFLREFVFGNNETGLVTSVKGHTTVIGGEDPQLANTVLTGQSGIYYGSGTTQYTYTYPTATIAAWETFIAFATDTENGKVAASATAAQLVARTAL
ncbi:hypothetical protein PHLCEN_2v12222 [Hermanssonia centrifuga]|uniref:Carboxypeptidase n=1 Tax=Hermanssonia centrifuga TaxID=98765 RepID=A0A2R6NHZ9_9APHY|nr:hypothetical protein PHLCEN_2v12222 [Hermanssonia centrifuga]